MQNKIKNNLFSVLSGRMEVCDFEKWIFNDQEFQDGIVQGGLVLEIASINYRSADVLMQLEKLYFDTWSEENFELSYVEWAACQMLENGHTYYTEKLIGALARRYNFDSPSKMLFSFYRLADQLDLAGTYYGSTKWTINRMVQAFALELLEAFDGKSTSEKLQLMNEMSIETYD